MDWLKHAFAIEGPDGEPTPEETQLVDRLCHEIVRRRLTVPAMVFLEMSLPLNKLGAQALHFFSPLLDMFSKPAEGESTAPRKPAHQILAAFLERPGSIARLSDRIEAIEKTRLPSDGKPGETAPHQPE